MATISEETLKKTITYQIEEIIDNEGLNDCTYEIKLIPCTARNFTGALYTIDVNDKQKGLLPLFAKIANITEFVRQYIPVVEMYNRERFLYKEIVAVYEDIQTKHGIPEEGRYKFAKYYSSNSEQMEEVIIFENLTAKGYEVGDRFKSIDYEYAKKGIEELAKFHALSFTLERENPEFFKEKIVPKNEFVNGRAEGEEAEKYRNRLFATFFDIIINPDYCVRLKAFMENVTKEMWADQFKIQRRPVLVHGDFRQSNLMTRYEEGKIVDMIPVDYQTVYYGSPVNDLVYFIFTGTDEEFREKYYEEIVEYYYTCLTKSLASFGLDVKDVYPKEDYKLDLKERIVYGLIMALFILPYILIEEKPDFNVNIEDLLPKHGNTFNHRFNGIINDFVKWGYL